MTKNWNTKKLKELATINYGKSPKEIISEGGTIPVVGTGGVERLGSNYLYDGESVILGRKGTIDKPTYLNGKFWAIDTAYFLSNFKDANVKWLYYFLKTVDLRAMNEATGVPSLSREFLYQLDVPTPRKEEQEKIAAILSRIDRAIEQTEAVIAKQQRIKAGLMHDLLTKGIDEHGNIRSETTHEFKDSRLGRIPVEWEVAPLASRTLSSAFGPRFPSQAYAENGNVATLRTTDMDDEGNLNLKTMPLANLDLNSFKLHFLHRDDVVVSRSGTCGITAVFTEFHLPVLPGAFLIRFRVNPLLLSPYFLKSYFNWETGSTRVLDLAEGGVQKNLRASSLLQMKLPFPSVHEQERINQVLDIQDRLIESIRDNSNKLKECKTGLMQDLLTGKVPVTPLLETPPQTVSSLESLSRYTP